MGACSNCGYGNVKEPYTLCWQCYSKNRDVQGLSPPSQTLEVERVERERPVNKPLGTKAWHDDPIVDALLKINSNLASIKLLIEAQNKDKALGTKRILDDDRITQ